MSFLSKIKPNKPVVGLEGYFFAILGKSKFGKTTFVYDLMKEYFDGDLSKALLLAPEIGYKTLHGIHALPIGNFKATTDEEKEEQGTYGFIETVDDLIENKKEVSYRAIIIDTITALEDLALKYMLKRESIKAKKKYSTISDIAYGGGYTMLADVIYEQIDRLKKAGFFVIIIGHEKVKQVKNRDGSEYNLITLNCQGKVTDIIEREADLIIYGDLVTDVKGDSVSQKRVLRFRSDGNIVCGSRFRAMPDSIDLDVKEFLATFKEAVLASFNGDKEAVKVAEKEQAVEREEKANSYVDQVKSEASTDDLIKEVDVLVKKMNADQQAELKVELKDKLGSVNYKKYDVEKLNQAVEIAKGILA